MLLLKRPPVRILTATLALMLLPSCRKLVLEDRMDCPGYLYFQMKDSRELRENGAHIVGDYLYATAYGGWKRGRSGIRSLCSASLYLAPWMRFAFPWNSPRSTLVSQ